MSGMSRSLWLILGVIGFALILTALALYTHRKNFDRLRRGEENRIHFFGIRKVKKPDSKPK